MDRLWTSYTPDSNLSLNHGKIIVEPTSRQVLDIAMNKTDTNSMLTGLTFMQEKWQN